MFSLNLFSKRYTHSFLFHNPGRFVDGVHNMKYIYVSIYMKVQGTRHDQYTVHIHQIILFRTKCLMKVTITETVAYLTRRGGGGGRGADF